MEMNYVLDTSAYARAFAGDESLASLLSPGSNIYVPVIVLGELSAGFEYGSRPQENYRILHEFMGKPNVVALIVDEDTAANYGRIYAQLRREGKMINLSDIWIAALCVQHDLPLLTFDNDFRKVEGLELVHKP